MSKDELEALWEYSLTTVETFAAELKTELTELAANSVLTDRLEPVVETTYESIWSRAGARPDKDVATVTAWLLSELLGGDVMLQSLEDTDKTLVLIPKAEEDEHLVFWK